MLDQDCEMTRRGLDKRLGDLELASGTSRNSGFDLSVLSDDELSALEATVLTGIETSEALAAADKARRSASRRGRTGGNTREGR